MECSKCEDDVPFLFWVCRECNNYESWYPGVNKCWYCKTEQLKPLCGVCANHEANKVMHVGYLNCVKCGGELDKKSSGAICTMCSDKISKMRVDEALEISEKLHNLAADSADSDLPAWEYMVISRQHLEGDNGINCTSVRDTLNDLGADGWELIPFTLSTHREEMYILKREV